MNLLELMLKEEVTWPDGAGFAVQNSDGRLAYWCGDKPDLTTVSGWGKDWPIALCYSADDVSILADNWDRCIIGREEYQVAGGKMAVDAVGFTPFVSVEDAATAKQAAPKGSGNPILGMVLADLTNRALEGKDKYGEPLKAHNGRNPLWDAYQEALDLAMYLRQAIEEQQ